MKIYDFEVIDRCLYWQEKNTLIIGDLHLGYEDALSKSGYVGIPRTQKQENEKIFERIFQKTGNKIERLIFLGDIKHNFGSILKQEFNDFYYLLDFLKTKLPKLKKIIITKGNHDVILEYMIKDYSIVELKDCFVEDGKIFFHGDSKSLEKIYLSLADKNIKTVILGHFHPAFILSEKDNSKKERYKCFLYGKTKKFKKNTIYVPSFFPLIEGADVFTETEIYDKNMKTILIDEEGNLYKK